MSSFETRPMKRFYTSAEVVVTEDGLHAVRLDGRPVRTPSKAPLAVPHRALAEAIAAEWNAQGDVLCLSDMPMTQLANSAIDRVGTMRPAMVEAIMRFADTELLCYRAGATESAELARRQERAWEPLLEWVRAAYGAALYPTAGLMPVDQPPEALAALRAAVEALDDWRLTAFQAAVAPLGSLVLALALVDGRLDAEAAFQAAYLDEYFQIEQWGEDAELMDRLERQRNDIANAARFLKLVGS